MQAAAAGTGVRLSDGSTNILPVGKAEDVEAAWANHYRLVRLAPDEEFVVDPDKLLHRNKISAYAGRRLAGVVRETWLRGVSIDETPRGRLLRRGER